MDLEIFIEKLKAHHLIDEQNIVLFKQLASESAVAPEPAPEYVPDDASALPEISGSSSEKYGAGDWTSVSGEGLDYPGEADATEIPAEEAL